MATNFPSTLDDATSIPVEASGTALSVNHVTAHQNLQDAVEAIEAKIGVDSSVVTTSHDYKLSGITGSDKALKSGTSTQSVTGLTLVTPKITLGSDAVGDIHYTSNVDGTQTRIPVGSDNYIVKLNGTTPNWEAETATVDASTTVKGIVEAATSAEVTAGTATGGTGAVLVVTPDALAASTPVFNGSGLTNTIQGYIEASASNSSAVTSTIAETTVATIAVPGNILGTNKFIKVRAFFVSSWTADGNNVTYRIKYGGTTLGSFVIDPTGTPTQTMSAIMEIQIQGAGTTSSQEGSSIFIQSGEATGATPIIQVASISSSAIDSTTSQNIIITVQNGGSGSSQTTTLQNYSVQKIV